MENPFKNKPHPYEQHGGGRMEYGMFSAEIDRLIAEGNPYFKDFTPEDVQQLTPWDVRTWMLFAGGRMTEREFGMRKRTMETELAEQGAKLEGNPRERFYAYLGDQVVNRIAAEQLDEMQKAKR
jgi:hypothetical protein